MTSAIRKRRAYAARVPAEQRRTELLDAALHLVVTRGHQASTMAAVAEAAGVTKPVVYGLFASRADLLAALLRREQEAALRQLLAILPTESAGSTPAEVVARTLAEFLRIVRAAPDRWHCIVAPMPDLPPEFHAARERARELAMVRAETMVAQLLHAIGAPAGLAPDLVANAAITLFEMAARMVLSDPDNIQAQRLETAVLAAFAFVDGSSRAR